MTQDTGKARLPGLPQVNTGNPALDRWIQAVTERLEVREGARGNPAEQVVLQRDIKALGLSGPPIYASGSVNSTAGDVVVARPDGTYARLSVDAFGDAVRRTNVYRELTQAIDDPNRFNDVPVVVRDLLTTGLADEAQKRGADIRLLESKQQSATESLAYTVKTVTAAVDQAAAGIREVDYAAANANSATAGRVLQIQSRINDFNPDGLPGTATLEQRFKTVADRTKGLESSYFLKVGVGVGNKNKVAGFGVSATVNTLGATDSAFIVLADKFAVVTPSDVISDPLNPPADRIPFGVDATGVYINGKVRINTGGQTIESVGRRIALTADSTVFKVSALGAASPGSITLTAALSGGLVGTPSFTVLSGSASLSGSGFTRTLFYGALGSDQVVVRATVAMEGVAYNADLAIYRAFDGVQGVKGTTGDKGIAGDKGVAGVAGVRGSVTRYGSLSGGNAWNSSDFSQADGLVGLPQVIGDTVTLSNSSAAVTKYWSGFSWVDPGVVIDGNLLVKGTVSADKIAAGTITAAVSLNSSGFIKVDGATASTSLQGRTTSGAFNESGGAEIGVIGSSSRPGAGVVGYGTGSAYGVWAYSLNGVALQVSGTANFSGQAIFNNSIRSDLPTYVGPPLTVASTGLCTNLNADLLDGKHATDFAVSGHAHTEYYPASNPNGYVSAAGHTHSGLITAIAGNVGGGAPSGGGLIFSCLIPGFRFRVSGNFVLLEVTP